MQTIDINVEERSSGGKGAARKLRQEGKAPATVYGPTLPAQSVAFDRKDFARRVASLEGTHLLRLSGAINGKVVLVKDTQLHPITGAILHADFYEVDMSKELEVQTPLHFVGKSEGVVRGGILQPIERELTIRCLPDNIPEYIEVQVEALDIHDTVHVSQLELPDGVSAVFDSDIPLVTVLSPAVEKAEEAEAGEGEEGAADATEEQADADPAKGAS